MRTPAVARTTAKPWGGGDAMAGKSQPTSSLSSTTKKKRKRWERTSADDDDDDDGGGRYVSSSALAWGWSLQNVVLGVVLFFCCCQGDGNDNAVVKVDDEDADDIRDNGAAVGEAMPDAATDAKGGGMKVIDEDDKEEDEDEDEVVDDVDAGNDGSIHRHADPRLQHPHPPAGALPLLRRAAAQSPADDRTSSGSIRNPQGGGHRLECQRRCCH